MAGERRKTTGAEEDAREIARMLSGALPGGYEVRLRVTGTPLPESAEPVAAGSNLGVGLWRGNAFKAEFELYWRFGAMSFSLIRPIADSGWRRTREEACAGLLREFGSMRHVRYMNEGARRTVCFPAAESPEELELLLAVEGCSAEGENGLSRPA